MKTKKVKTDNRLSKGSMTLKEARALRDFLRAQGVVCTVPRSPDPSRYGVQCKHGVQFFFRSVAEYNLMVHVCRRMKSRETLKEFKVCEKKPKRRPTRFTL